MITVLIMFSIVIVYVIIYKTNHYLLTHKDGHIQDYINADVVESHKLNGLIVQILIMKHINYVG